MHGRLLVSIKLGNVISNRSCDLSGLQPCNHWESDTRIFLHLAHAAAQGHRTFYIRTVDSDVVVLAIRLFTTLGLKHLWVGIGTEKKFPEIAIHDICSNLGSSKSQKLPLFISCTDWTWYDFTVSCCGKKSAWALWQMPNLTETLAALTNDPMLFSMDSVHMQRLERFVAIMYSKGCGLATVNEVRRRLFSGGIKNLQNNPPTQGALFQHIKRALLQASFYCNQATSVCQRIPDHSDWSWQKDGADILSPYWTSLANASKACSIILHCRCVNSCTEIVSVDVLQFVALHCANVEVDVPIMLTCER